MRKIAWMMGVAVSVLLLSTPGWAVDPSVVSQEAPPEPSDQQTENQKEIPNRFTPYLLGPGDALQVHLLNSQWEGPERETSPFEQMEFTVTPEGLIQVPPIGGVMVAGKTIQELEETLNTQIKRFYRYAKVTVILLHLRELNIRVSGLVAREGAYRLEPGTTLTQALEQAGGVAFQADLSHVKLQRLNCTALTLDLWSPDSSDEQQVRLEDGDILAVPALQGAVDWKAVAHHKLMPKTFKVRILGAVAHPGEIEVPLETDLLSAVSQVGGLTPHLLPRRVTLMRPALSTTQVDEIPLRWSALQRGEVKMNLIPGDWVIVGSPIGPKK